MTSVVRIGSPFVSEKFIGKRVSDVRLRVCFEKPSGIEFFLKHFQLERISEYFSFGQDLNVRFMEVHFFPGSEKSVRFNQVSALQCPLYGGDSMCVY